MKYLITGAAGFIGFHLARRILNRGDEVLGIDNLNDYYDVNLKKYRLQNLGIKEANFIYKKAYLSKTFTKFSFIKIDIADKVAIAELFAIHKFDMVLNFAAQAGVIYSKENPDAYIHSNIYGFINILEGAKKHNCKLVYASSSSVYGATDKIPFCETNKLKEPKNLYAKTKIHNEELAQIYWDYMGLQSIGLRMFSVYGAFGRPDMVSMIFAEAMQKQKAITIYGDGNAKRDYTFVDDVVTAIVKLMEFYADKEAQNAIFNIGSENPVSLSQLIEKLEAGLKIKALKSFLPPRPEEIDTTFADTSKLQKTINYKPETTFDKGMSKFLSWHSSYHQN